MRKVAVWPRLGILRQRSATAAQGQRMELRQRKGVRTDRTKHQSKSLAGCLDRHRIATEFHQHVGVFGQHVDRGF